MKSIMKKIAVLLLTLSMVFSDLLSNIGIYYNAFAGTASFDTSNYEKTYGLSYENLFELCPDYLDAENIDLVIGHMETDASEASYIAQTQINNAEFIHSLDKGIMGTINWILGEAGITETEYEQYRNDIALKILKDYFSSESAEKQIVEKISSNLGKIDKVYDTVNDITNFSYKWAEAFGSYDDYENAKKMVEAITGSKEMEKYMNDTTKTFNIVVELMTLYEMDYQSINVILEALDKIYPNTDLELKKGLSAVKTNIEMNPAQYLLDKYVKTDVINAIVKQLEDAAIEIVIGTNVTRAIAIAKKVIVKVYEWINPSYEEIQKVFIAYSLYDEASKVVNGYKKIFKRGNGTTRDIVLYEVAYNLKLSVLKEYINAGRDCLRAGDNKKLKLNLESWVNMIGNQLTYEAYITSCMSNVKADIDAGTLVIKENAVQTPASEQGYSSEESIKSKFAAIQSQYPPNVGIAWTGKWEGASQCFGFARMVFYKLYGCQMSYHYDYPEMYRYTDETNVDLIGQVSGSSVNAASIKAVLQQGKLGDIIQASGATYGQHTMIFVSADDNGVTVYDCNAKLNSSEGECLIHQWTISYDSLTAWYGTGNSSIANGLSLYRASNYASIYGDGEGLFYDDSVNFVIENGVLTKYNGWQSFVVIPDEVTAIGDGAFKNNTTMLSVEIPDGVKSIGNEAFYGCTRLAGVLIPDSVESIGNSAFSGCTALSTVVLPENDKFEVINSSAFNNCTSLARVEIPDSVTAIDTEAFYECKNMSEVVLSKNLRSMWMMAFGFCNKLETIEIPKSLINTCNPFIGDDNLKTIKFEKGIEIIGKGLFAGCEGIEEVKIPDTVLVISTEAFDSCINLRRVEIPNSVTMIGSSAFRQCYKLTQIMLPDGLNYVGDYAFKWCRTLSQVNIPDTVTYLGDGAFYECTGLTDISMGTGLKEISQNTFYGCTTLQSVIIPANVTKISDSAFANCVKLTDIAIPAATAVIADNAFSYPKKMTITGIKDSYAEEYAAKKGINFAVSSLDISSTDNIHIEHTCWDIDKSVTVKTKKLNENDNEYKNIVVDSSIKFTAYDIKLVDESNNTVQPQGTVTVKIPCPSGYKGSNSKVYYVDEKGNFTDMNAQYDGEYLTFNTDHFSTYMVTEASLETAESVKYGDINGDGAIDTQDAVLIKKYLAGYKGLSISLEACDVNGDGDVSSADAVLLLKYLAGYNVKLGK